jgi:hypothetical protein
VGQALTWTGTGLRTQPPVTAVGEDAARVIHCTEWDAPGSGELRVPGKEGAKRRLARVSPGDRPVDQRLGVCACRSAAASAEGADSSGRCGPWSGYV